jgi:hypothetical protein
MNSVQIEQKSYEMPPREGFTVAVGVIKTEELKKALIHKHYVVVPSMLLPNGSSRSTFEWRWCRKEYSSSRVSESPHDGVHPA